MSQWIPLCPLNDILPGSGVCGLIKQQQVAVFRPYADEQVLPLAISILLHKPVCYRGD